LVLALTKNNLSSAYEEDKSAYNLTSFINIFLKTFFHESFLKDLKIKADAKCQSTYDVINKLALHRYS